MGKNFLILAAFLLLTTPAIQCVALEAHMFEIDKEGNINTTIANAPLQEVLENFCSTFNLELKGTVASNETISLSMPKSTFDETLKRLMRGYNYVLLQDATSDKFSIILIGKAERSKYSEERPATHAATEPPAYEQSTIPPPTQRGLPPSAQPTAVTARAADSSPAPAAMERQKQSDEEKASGGEAAAARQVRTQSSASSTTPPAPPSISGLESPPMPPTLEQAKGNQARAATGEDSSHSHALDTPPEIPTTDSEAVQKARPKLDLKDLTPPSIPPG